MGIFGRIRDSLARTKEQIVERFDDIVRRADAPERRARTVDVETLGALEELLISADVGMAATDRIIKAVKARPPSDASLRDVVKTEIKRIFASVEQPKSFTVTPSVTLIVGVNGTGKTTTVGKLANLLKREGQQPLICAADTFRAAAVEQLEVWTRRAGVDIVRAREGADPAAVVFDAITSAKAKGRTPVLVDTAGRRCRREWVRGPSPCPMKSRRTRPPPDRRLRARAPGRRRRGWPRFRAARPRRRETYPRRRSAAASLRA
jgi:fused signal recognition particle receptor